MLKKILCLLLVFSFSTGVINFKDCNLYALESRSIEYYNTVTKPYSNYIIPGYDQDYICFKITAKIRYFVTSNGSVTPYLHLISSRSLYFTLPSWIFIIINTTNILHFYYNNKVSIKQLCIKTSFSFSLPLLLAIYPQQSAEQVQASRHQIHALCSSGIKSPRILLQVRQHRPV